MTSTSSTISPRRRSRAADAPTATDIATTPAPEIDAPPRVLIRLPAIAPVAPSAKAKSGTTAKPATAEGRGSKAGTATKLDQPSKNTAAADLPWYGRLYTPRVQKYLPYATALAIAFVGLIVVIRNHSHRARPAAAEANAQWNSGGAVPNRQAGSPSPAGSTNGPNWNGPAFPASPGIPPSAGPSGAGGSPSAYSPPSGANPSLSPTQAPTGGYPTSGYSSTAATGGAPTSPGDYVPPMPTRSPAWGNPPTRDPALAESTPSGSFYHTAANSDPAAIPPGHSPVNTADPGVARFEGTIARPQ